MIEYSLKCNDNYLQFYKTTFTVYVNRVPEELRAFSTKAPKRHRDIDFGL